MLNKSKTPKCLATVGMTLLFPIGYAIVHSWTIEPFATICWVVVGFAIGRDAVRMIWKWKGRQKTRAASVVRLLDRVGSPGRPVAAELDDQEPTMGIPRSGSGLIQIRTLDEQLGFRYFDRYDGYESSSDYEPPASVH